MTSSARFDKPEEQGKAWKCQVRGVHRPDDECGKPACALVCNPQYPLPKIVVCREHIGWYRECGYDIVEERDSDRNWPPRD